MVWTRLGRQLCCRGGQEVVRGQASQHRRVGYRQERVSGTWSGLQRKDSPAEAVAAGIGAVNRCCRRAVLSGPRRPGNSA